MGKETSGWGFGASEEFSCSLELAFNSNSKYKEWMHSDVWLEDSLDSKRFIVRQWKVKEGKWWVKKYAYLKVQFNRERLHQDSKAWGDT